MRAWSFRAGEYYTCGDMMCFLCLDRENFPFSVFSLTVLCSISHSGQQKWSPRGRREAGRKWEEGRRERKRTRRGERRGQNRLRDGYDAAGKKEMRLSSKDDSI